MIAALWWGGISGISFVAVPMLFAKLGSPAVAGPVAARLFSLQSMAGLVLGVVLLVLLRRRENSDNSAALQAALVSMGWVLLAMLAAMVQEFGVAHKILTARAAGESVRLWHGLGTALVFLQWVGAGMTLWRSLNHAPAHGQDRAS
ncbi:DUF4149 domain-containing protein [Hydrogenophaga sp. 5NK40-0174]|uniref:DUF4149 domain-containing protein n=1 Tax=Hydrogenophaga sp. 5NK40-0174 TaxID=3127649 RepID=UPI003105E0C8